MFLLTKLYSTTNLVDMKKLRFIILKYKIFINPKIYKIKSFLIIVK
jgi:hypothetical protein